MVLKVYTQSSPLQLQHQLETNKLKIISQQVNEYRNYKAIHFLKIIIVKNI